MYFLCSARVIMRNYDLRFLSRAELKGSHVPTEDGGQAASNGTAHSGAIDSCSRLQRYARDVTLSLADAHANAGSPEHGYVRRRRASITSLAQSIAQLQLREFVRSASGTVSSLPDTPSALCRGGDDVAEAVRHSKQYLNGVPCFLVEAYRVCGMSLTSLDELVEQIYNSIADAEAGRADLPLDLLDELIVSITASLTTLVFVFGNGWSTLITTSTQPSPLLLAGARCRVRGSGDFPALPRQPLLHTVRADAALRVQPRPPHARKLPLDQGKSSAARSPQT